jgi:hypothetical protein
VAKKRRRRRKRTWLGSLLFFILTPLIIWFVAFLIWFYWYDITAFSSRRDNTQRKGASKELDRPTKPSDKVFKERIGEEDRRKLDEILKSKK